MKKLAYVALILWVSVVSASAADMAVKAQPVAVAPTCVWCGFYTGVNAGYAWSGNASVNSFASVTNTNGGVRPATSAAAAAGLITSIPVGRRSGFIGGGQFGYNFESGSLVAGFEADIQGLSGRSTGTSTTTAPIAGVPGVFLLNATQTATNSVNWLGTVRGRIGLAVAPKVLIYGTGGLAYGGVSSNTNITEVGSGFGGTFPATGSFSQTKAGWTAGVGGEWMFTGNWSAKFEYLHYDLGSANYGTTVNNFARVGGVLPAGTLLYSLAQTSSTSFRGDIVRVGLNYKFAGY